jgi:hypothetical protein
MGNSKFLRISNPEPSVSNDKYSINPIKDK